VGQVVYTPWCDEQGKVIDDGTVSRLEENIYSLDRSRSESALVHAKRCRLDVQIEDISESVAALALAGTNLRTPF